MSSLLRATTTVLLGLSMACSAGADGTPAEDDASEGALVSDAPPAPSAAGSAEVKLPLSDAAPRTVVLATGDAVVVGLDARDPVAKEVDDQADDIGAATITVARISIQEDGVARSLGELDVEVRPGAVGTGKLTVAKPAASAVAALLKKNTRYRFAVTRNQATTSKFFSEVDLTIRVR